MVVAPVTMVAGLAAVVAPVTMVTMVAPVTMVASMHLAAQAVAVVAAQVAVVAVVDRLGSAVFGLVLFLVASSATVLTCSSRASAVLAVAWVTKDLAEAALLEGLRVAVASQAEEAASKCH